jgi:hypothetical protein
MKTLFCGLMLALLGTVAAKADTLTITLDQPIQKAAAGDTVEFFGTITNDSSSTIFLNNDSFTLAGLSLTVDDDFFNTPISLDAGETSEDVELFDVTVSDPLLDPIGTYSGSYELLGGTDGDAQNVIGTAKFAVTTVPEPGSIYLLLGGVSAGLAPVVRRVRAKAGK